MKILWELLGDIERVVTVEEPKIQVARDERVVGIADNELMLLVTLSHRYCEVEAAEITKGVQHGRMLDKKTILDALIALKLSKYGITRPNSVGYRVGWRIVLTSDDRHANSSGDIGTTYF